jgi:hypothetical protein
MHGGIRFDYTSGEMDRGFRMSDGMGPEALWSRLLSEKPALIRAAWKTLKQEERESIRRHLHAMAHQEGWQPSQRKAARTAEECLKEIRDS